MDKLVMVDMYINENSLAWSQTTMKSERARLAAIAHSLDGSPATLWRVLGVKTPYTRLTTWTRVMHFWDWALENKFVNGVNEYAAFKAKNRKQFKNVYQRQPAKLTYQEAKERIEGISDPAIKAHALRILGSGLRWAESQIVSDGKVIGKGAKSRDVYVPAISGPIYYGSYQNFRRQLAKAGLKPHDLRKIFATELVRNGAGEFELLDIMGWQSIGTATSYVKADKAKARSLVEMVQGVNSEQVS
jgi:integrase